MASNVRLGPFSEEQMDAVMGELVKTYCARHFKVYTFKDPNFSYFIGLQCLSFDVIILSLKFHY